MSEPTRVAQILGKMNSGGVEAVVMNYYRAIDRTKVQFDVFYDETSECPQKEELLSLGANVYPIPPYTKVVKYQKAIKAIFVQNKYKIVHSHLSTMSIFPLLAAWKAKVPVRICHNHSTATWHEPKKTLLKYILRPFNKIFATDYFACGEKAGRWMYGNKAFDTGKVYVMPNAIDTEKFAFNKQNREEIRKEFNIPNDTFVVGHIGRFTFAKNHVFLLDVFCEVIKEKPNSILLLVGEGELETEIKNKVQELNLSSHVIFAGVRQDVHKFYSAFDVFCLPSLYEGFPVVVVEAACANLPIFTSVNVSKEVLFFYSLKQIEFDTLQWCHNILNCPKIENEQNNFNIKLCGEKTLQIYQNMLGKIIC